eukprot:5303083-Prymnesium_polylepis.1
MAEEPKEGAKKQPAERGFPSTIEFFDREMGRFGTFYVDEETMGKLLDKIFFVYPYNVDIEAGFSPNGMPYKPGEFERVK